MDIYKEYQQEVIHHEFLAAQVGLNIDLINVPGEHDFDLNIDQDISDVEYYSSTLGLDEDCSNMLEPLMRSIESEKTKCESESTKGNRFVGMLSSSRFGEGTYKSMLENSSISKSDEKNAKADIKTDDGNSVESRTEGNNQEKVTDVSAFVTNGMADANATVRSHIFALGEIHEKLVDFLATLRSREGEASTLASPTKASDSALREIKNEWTRISKDMERGIQASIKDDTDKNENLKQLKEACIEVKNLCKGVISSLSKKLTLNIGLHSDTAIWEASIKSLPKGAIISGYSNPSIFCFMV